MNMPPWVACGLAFLLAYAVAGCTPTANHTAIAAAVAPTAQAQLIIGATAAERTTRGLSVYSAHYCGACHQLSAANSNATFAPSFDGLGSRALERTHAAGYTGTAKTAEDYIRESIRTPQLYIVDGYKATTMPMPTFKLTDQEIEDLVQMLLQQKKTK